MSLQRRWTIPRSALEKSYVEMARDGSVDREGIALWAGHDIDAEGLNVIITHVVLLRGPGIQRARGYIAITPELLNEITDTLAEVGNDTYLIGQIHGHPPFSSTRLSPTDIEGGIRTPEYLSVVAPNYGMNAQPDLHECGVHYFDPDLGWTTLSASEIDRHIVITHDVSLPVLVVGEEQGSKRIDSSSDSFKGGLNNDRA
jgi:hypothetical protein